MKRLNQDLRTSDVTDVTISRIDARLDTLDTEVSAIEATLAAQVLIDADFDARITALEGGGGGGGVSEAKALTFGFMRC